MWEGAGPGPRPGDIHEMSTNTLLNAVFFHPALLTKAALHLQCAAAKKQRQAQALAWTRSSSASSSCSTTSSHSSVGSA